MDIIKWLIENWFTATATFIAVLSFIWAVITQIKNDRLKRKINIQADYSIELKDVRKQKDFIDIDITISSKLNLKEKFLAAYLSYDSSIFGDVDIHNGLYPLASFRYNSEKLLNFNGFKLDKPSISGRIEIWDEQLVNDYIGEVKLVVEMKEGNIFSNEVDIPPDIQLITI